MRLSTIMLEPYLFVAFDPKQCRRKDHQLCSVETLGNQLPAIPNNNFS